MNIINFNPSDKFDSILYVSERGHTYFDVVVYGNNTQSYKPYFVVNSIKNIKVDIRITIPYTIDDELIVLNSEDVPDNIDQSKLLIDIKKWFHEKNWCPVMNNYQAITFSWNVGNGDNPNA